MSEEQIKSTEELNQTPVETVEAEEKFAKSGKKSKKHLEEVKAEEECKARAEEHKRAIVHIGVGKTDFTIDQLNETLPFSWTL